MASTEVSARATSVEQTVSTTPTTSADGRLIAYAGAPLDPADTRESTVYLLDRADGSTRELTPLLDGVRAGSSLWPVVSADGCTVTVISEMSFDLFRDDDEGSRWDVYRTVLPHCDGDGDWELVSATNGSGFGAAAGDDVSPLYPPAVSGEGSLVAYTRQFSLTAPDVTGVELVDLTVPIGDPGRSQPIAGTPAAAPQSTFRYHGVREPAMSTDGSVIAFTSDANAAAPLPDWGSGPQPGGYATSNVYVWNRADLNPGTAVRRVSVPTGAETGDSTSPAVSGDGSRVAFVSNAINLVAGAALPACTPTCVPQVYLVDIATGAIRLGSRVPGDPATAPTGANAAALQPALDHAGEELAFVTRATNLFASHSPAVGGPTDGDIVVAVPDTGEARRASTPDGATPAPAANSHPRLSANGRVVVFDTLAGAAYGQPGVSGRQVVVVGQDPELDLADLDMGTVAVTFPGPEWFLVVRNDGPSSFVPAEVTTDAADFLISGGTCMENAGTPVPPGGTCTVNLMFMPAKEGRQQATLTVSEAGFGAVSVSSTLTGFGGEPQLAPSPAGGESRPVLVGGRGEPVTFSVYNVAFNPVRIASVRLQGTNPADFAVIDDTCTGVTIDAGESCTLAVVFAPLTAGRLTTSVVVSTSQGAYTTMLMSGQAAYDPKIAAGTTTIVAGSRVTVTGAGFAPNAGVGVGWSDGYGRPVIAFTDAFGTFSVELVVLPTDRPGDRRLVAQSGSLVAVTDVVVVAPSRTTGPASPAWPGR